MFPNILISAHYNLFSILATGRVQFKHLAWNKQSSSWYR